MVAERASQDHAPAHLQALDCFPNSPSRAQAMASDMASAMSDMASNVVFTPAYEQNLQALHNERAMLVAGLLAAARVCWGMGREWVKAKLRKMAGDDDQVDIEEILNIVEKESPAKTGGDGEDSDTGRPTVKKHLGFDQLQLTPPKAPAQPPTTAAQSSLAQPQLQPSTTTASNSLVSIELAVQLQKRLDKEQEDQNFNDDLAKAKLLSLEQPNPPVQPDPMQDPTKEPWSQYLNAQGRSATGTRAEESIGTRVEEPTDKDTMIKLLYDEVIKLKNIVSKQQEPHTPVAASKQHMFQTPVVTRMDTPTIDKVANTPMNGNQHKEVNNVDMTKLFDRLKQTPNVGTTTNTITATGRIQRVETSPYSDGSSNGDGGLFQLSGVAANGGGQDDGGGDEGGEPGGSTITNNGNATYTNNKEFILVNPRNVTVQTFSGTNLHTRPYMPFNKAMRQLMRAQGGDGELLLKMFDQVEKWGSVPFDNDQLNALATQYPIVTQFNIAIQTALENYTTDVAEGMVRYGVLNGLEAWRRPYNHYVPMAEDLQNILIQELYELRPVEENSVDKLFNEIQRISELYVRAGTEDISEKWLVAAVKRNLPAKITNDLAMELRKLKRANAIELLAFLQAAHACWD